MLNHEQACFYKGVLRGESPSCPLDHIDSNGAILKLTDSGHQALAEYDSHYTTVEKAELERLRAKERKIEAFLGSVRRKTVSIEIGTPEQMYVIFDQNGNSWHVVCQNAVDGNHVIETNSQGEAMRKAFELFEVPEEGV